MKNIVIVILLLMTCTIGYSQKWANVEDLDQLSSQGVLSPEISSLYNIDPIGKKKKDIIKLYKAVDEHPSIENAVIPYFDIQSKQFPFVSVICEMPDTMGTCLSSSFRIVVNGQKFKDAYDFQKLVDLFNMFDSFVSNTATLTNQSNLNCADAKVLSNLTGDCKAEKTYALGNRKVFLSINFTLNKERTYYSYIDVVCKQIGKK